MLSSVPYLLTLKILIIKVNDINSKILAVSLNFVLYHEILRNIKDMVVEIVTCFCLFYT